MYEGMLYIKTGEDAKNLECLETELAELRKKCDELEQKLASSKVLGNENESDGATSIAELIVIEL